MIGVGCNERSCCLSFLEGMIVYAFWTRANTMLVDTVPTSMMTKLRRSWLNTFPNLGMAIKLRLNLSRSVCLTGTDLWQTIPLDGAALR